jgi:methylamine--corrinoid protein Co-methyltransferase
MKTTFNLLSKTKFYLDYGCPIYSYADQLIGGYTGGAETTAISMTAHILANLLISQSSVQEISCQDIRNNSTSGRMSIWNHSVVSQALARNTGIISFSESFAAAGPCTEMLLYESVAPALAVVSGSHAGPGPAGCGTREIDKYTGLEERFFGEVAQSLAGQKLEYVNDLAKAVLPKYEHMLTRAPHGKRFQECYNVEMTTPSSEWISILHSVKKELRQIGLELEGDADGMSTDRSNVGMK